MNTFFRKVRNKILWELIKHLPDKLSIQLRYKLEMKRMLNLNNPQTFNEKLQWLKLYNRRPEYTIMVDKIKAKDWVAERIGNDYIIPTLAVYKDANDINFDTLPNQFVLKCNHDSSDIIICKDKSKLNEEDARKKLNQGLKSKVFYQIGREWPYKNIQPRILAEKYMEDETGELRDFKFFCFNGVVKALFIATDRSNPNEETKFDFFDENFNHLPFTNGHPNSNKKFEKPKNFELMIKLASQLSQNIPHVRIDFYNINGKIYFGEITFFHWSGLRPFVPEKWDYIFGSWIQLPPKRCS